MTFEDAIAIMYENENDRLIDDMYKEDPELSEENDCEPDFDEADLYESQIAQGK